MSLSATKSRLAALTNDLSARWRETRESWRDDRALEFEQRYLDDLFAGVNNALNNIDTLERILHRVRDDCE
ncbi:MAG: hypothetical protein MUE94_02780 [Verrucomicrobia bacterium]|jgi:hypothetical protein|nr:hypothetical protein [Verrucomicrobiota bacterium]